MNQGDEKLLEDVKTYGWHVLKVFDKQGELPDFAYSIGTYHSFKQPEIILFGLDLNDMHKIINDIVGAMKAGKTLVPEVAYSDFLEGFDCMFRPVKKKHYEEYLGYAKWFYKSEDFPALQCFWPDKYGRYPWEEGFVEELMKFQPLLYKG